LDGFDQIANTAKSSATNSLSCDFCKPALDLIEPGRTGWGEVDVIARSCRQPLLHFGMFVRAVIVENQMDLHARVNGLVDPVEKPQELLVPVPRLALSDHGAFEYV